MSEEPYANIRTILGQFIGQKLVDITQHDEEEWADGKEAYICLMFEGGGTITIPIGDDGLNYTDTE
jgi:hypothetical protein